MSLRNKALPYPVLDQADAGRDDYISGDFRAFLSINEVVDGLVTVNVRYSCSVGELNELVQQGKAQYCLLVLCPDTLTRQAYKTGNLDQVIELRAFDFHDRVEFIPQLVMTQEVQDFTCLDFNPEYSDQAFHLKPGDILALAKPEVCFFWFDKLGLKDLFRVERSEDLNPLQYSVSTADNYLHILMGSKLRELWDEIRVEPTLQPLIGMSIYKDCIMIAIDEFIRNRPEALEKAWGRALQRKLEFLGVSELENLDELNKLAQKLLEDFSVKRLASRRVSE